MLSRTHGRREQQYNPSQAPASWPAACSETNFLHFVQMALGGNLAFLLVKTAINDNDDDDTDDDGK